MTRVKVRSPSKERSHQNQAHQKQALQNITTTMRYQPKSDLKRKAAQKRNPKQLSQRSARKLLQWKKVRRKRRRRNQAATRMKLWRGLLTMMNTRWVDNWRVGGRMILMRNWFRFDKYQSNKRYTLLKYNHSCHQNS